MLNVLLFGVTCISNGILGLSPLSSLKTILPRLRRLRNSTRTLASLAITTAILVAVGEAQTVTILQPTANTTAASPLRIQATVQSANPVSLTQIYVDGAKMFQTAGAGVNTSLPLTAGLHRVSVQAVDSKQQVFKSTVYVTVSSASQPLPSTGSTIFDRIEEKTGWQTCGACGNTGGTGTVANYLMTRGFGSPSLDGSSAQFAISGTPFKNGYWYIGQRPAPSTGLQYLRYEFDLYIPSGYQNAPQAIEFECQQRLNGWVYNFAWQAEYPINVWRVFNYTTKHWESTGIKLVRFTPGVWHHIVAEYHTDASRHLVYHDALTVDGIRHSVNLVHTAKQTSGSTNYLTNAFQLDLNAQGTPYKVYVDKMKVTLR